MTPDWRDTEAGLEVRAAHADYQEPGRLTCPQCDGSGLVTVTLSCPCVGSGRECMACGDSGIADESEYPCGRCEGEGWLPACPECGEEPAGDLEGRRAGEECSFTRRQG